MVIRKTLEEGNTLSGVGVIRVVKEGCDTTHKVDCVSIPSLLLNNRGITVKSWWCEGGTMSTVD